MNTLHRISQAEILAVLETEANVENNSITYNLAVTGNWNGEGEIEFSAPSGSSTGPFQDISSFSFAATSSFGTANFSAVDLAFAYWNVGPSGLMTSFSILTNPINGFSLSMQLGQEGAKLEGRKFATLEAGTLTHSSADQNIASPFDELERRLSAGMPMLRRVK